VHIGARSVDVAAAEQEHCGPRAAGDGAHGADAASAAYRAALCRQAVKGVDAPRHVRVVAARGAAAAALAERVGAPQPRMARRRHGSHVRPPRRHARSGRQRAHTHELDGGAAAAAQLVHAAHLVENEERVQTHRD
jgi:hypothetical protein